MPVFAVNVKLDTNQAATDLNSFDLLPDKAPVPQKRKVRSTDSETVDTEKAEAEFKEKQKAEVTEKQETQTEKKESPKLKGKKQIVKKTKLASVRSDAIEEEHDDIFLEQPMNSKTSMAYVETIETIETKKDNENVQVSKVRTPDLEIEEPRLETKGVKDLKVESGEFKQKETPSLGARSKTMTPGTSLKGTNKRQADRPKLDRSKTSMPSDKPKSKACLLM